MTVKPFQHILMPTDFSTCSAAAAARAAQLARQLGAAVELITVVDTSPLQEVYGDLAYRAERIAHIRGRAAQQLDAFAHRYLGEVPEVHPQVRDGDAFLEILRAVADTGSDLIVMGTHGRTGLSHLLIGSVAEKVVRKSPVPVLTVRAPESEASGTA